MSQIIRRDFTNLVGLGAASLLSANTLYARESTQSSSKHPNILLIITDQQHAGMMSCAGNPDVKTPELDRLASRGVRFERAYCGNPVCVPSRFSMMTGVLPSRIGMEKNGQVHVPPEIMANAMGNTFRDQGYKTVYGGKVHLPGDRSKGIRAYGFEYLIDDEREDLAEACGSFLQQKHERPFLLVASFINPHDICYMAIDAYTKAKSIPLMFPKSVRERECLAEDLKLPPGVTRNTFFEMVCPPLPDNFEIPENEPKATRDTDWREFRQYAQDHWSEEDWRLHRWAYARLTERVDEHIGKVLDSLQKSGLVKNTVVVFTSDHGDMDSAHRLEHKSMPYEEAARIPLIISQSGVTAKGKVDRENLVSNGLDLIPTLCDFAGIQIPSSLKGKSIKSLTTSPEEKHSWRKNLVVENEGSRILISERYKYVVYDHGMPREMLIDLKTDPGEMNNLVVDEAFNAILAKHRLLLLQWYKNNGEMLDDKYIISATGQGRTF